MREIKFRVYDTEVRRMYVNCPNVMVDYRGHPLWQFGYDEPRYMTDCVVMQFTGLEDKSGKEIYEGDLMCTVKGVLMVVRWSDLRAKFCVAWRNSYNIKAATLFYKGMEYASREAEVIGNIYENPELLKGGQ